MVLVAEQINAQLSMVDALFPKYLTLKSRLENFKEYLEFEEILSQELTTHPAVIKMFNDWQEYISLNTEVKGAYDEFKKVFINALGQKVFEKCLMNTYYFWRTEQLIKKGLTDIDNREI